MSLEALGDFEGSAFTSDTAPGDASGDSLPFPARTLAVSSLAQGGGHTWRGLGEAGTRDDIELLLWRAEDHCTLLPADGSSASTAAGVALGALPSRRLLLAAGGLVPSADAARAFGVDLGTGERFEVENGMLPGRAFATITAFGADALLVAGGVDPSLAGADLDAAPAIDSATVYDAARRRFDRQSLVPLSQPRARHGAVVLESGETLLVGGQGPNGTALSTLEAISPVDRSSRVAGLATLKRARIAPAVLALDDGRVFVGGGTNAGAVVSSLEWLAPDASNVTLIQENVVLAPGAAFSALRGGGVLGVGVCVRKTPQSCAASVLARRVTWIRDDGRLDELPELSFSPDSSALVAGTNGAPWLLARVGPSPVWKRFDPWTGLFDEPTEQPSSAPTSELPAPFAVEPGLFVWLEQRATGAALLGFRHDVRGTFARDVAPILLSGREHVAPSRAPLDGSGIDYGGDGLVLGSPAVSARVTDTAYADVTLELVLSSGIPPILLFGAHEVGGAECPWPNGAPATPGESMRVVRRGKSVTLERAGATTRCTVGEHRLGLGLAGPGNGESRVRSLSIRRE